MKCPVCPIDPVPEGATVCPGCGANVSPLRRLEELGTAFYCEAVQLARENATDEAIARASGVLALDSRNAKARKLLGKLLWRKGQVREAAQQWERAVALAPDDGQLRDLVSGARRRLRLRSIVIRAGLAAAVLVAAVSAGFLFRGSLASLLEALTASHGDSLP